MHTLANLITEYGHSLTRIEAEKSLMKEIALRAENECGVTAGKFKRLATDAYRDNIDAARAEMRELIELYDTVQPETD
jgi:hypothetical protein